MRVDNFPLCGTRCLADVCGEVEVVCVSVVVDEVDPLVAAAAHPMLALFRRENALCPVGRRHTPPSSPRLARVFGLSACVERGQCVVRGWRLVVGRSVV